MIEWEVIDAGIRAVDGAKTEIVVGAEGWRGGARERTVGHPVDETASGLVEELRIPNSFATLTDLDAGRTVELTGPGTRDLGPGEYLLNVDASVKTYVRFPGPATLSRPDYEALGLGFQEPTTVTLGFRSRLTAPEGTVTVPATPDGLATAVTHTASALRTTKPERSYSTRRSHPPRIEFGDEVDVPASVAADTPDTGVEVAVPDSLQSVFVVTPLAFYLGADVVVEPGAPAVLRAPAVGLRERLDRPALVERVPSLLARNFWLDSLVRNVGPHGTDLAETDLLSELHLDAEALYDGTLAERLGAYLAAPYERVADRLPEWHLSMHVEASLSHARTLPYLLDRLSLVYPPETEELEGKELMERSLDDFYRAAGQAPSIDRLKPKLRSGQVHGWLAEGTPIDVFKSLPAAYINRFDYLGRGDDRLAVTVVLNESAMEGEQSEVAEIYRERSADLPMDVSLRYDLARDDLADVFAADNDFVHYIGHCETGGLRCADGTLAVADVPESNTQTFFLNACGSYYEGLELIRKGSVAGAVTFRKVLDKQAAKVGTAFARLLVHGFSIERAIRLARRRIMMGKDYAVVGDGTHVLGQSENFIPTTGRVAALGDGRYSVTCEAQLSHTAGGHYQLFVPGEERSHLVGNEASTVLSEAELRSFLRRAEMPIIYEGRFRWADELLEAFE